MSKSVSGALETHIGQDLTTLSTCWRVEWTDSSTVLSFTDHDVDILFDAITYKAETGFTRSAVKSQLDFTVDNLDVQGILDSNEISETDLRAGRFNGAEIYVFLINWDDTTQGILKLRRGTLGQVKMSNGIFIAELQGLAQRLSNEILEEYVAECQADFGDMRCGFNTATLLQTSQVVSVTDARRTFTVLESIGSGSLGIDFSLSGLPSYGYKYGRLEWTSGPNNGIVQELKTAVSATLTFSLYLKAPFTITAGDTFNVTAGCDKRFVTCKFYARQKSFRGYPDIPGQDRYLNYPDAQT